jgi:hypothetical protein
VLGQSTVRAWWKLLLTFPAVPGLLNVSNIVGSQLANVGSPDIVSASPIRMSIELIGYRLEPCSSRWQSSPTRSCARPTR